MLYRVYNSGEIPPLAHGWRSVIALRPGRRWITLIDWTTLETAPPGDRRMGKAQARCRTAR